MTDSQVTSRDEQWRQFYATQLERQTAALESADKKMRTIEIQLSALLTLMVLGGVIVLIAALAG